MAQLGEFAKIENITHKTNYKRKLIANTKVGFNPSKNVHKNFSLVINSSSTPTSTTAIKQYWS